MYWDVIRYMRDPGESWESLEAGMVGHSYISLNNNCLNMYY